MMKNRLFSMLAAALLVGVAALVLLTGCNRQLVDTTYNYDTAILSLPDGTTVSGDVESWKDYTDGDQIQVKIDGVTYLVHSANVVLIKGEKK